MAHYSIFREELAITYPTYGNALWEPDPGGQYNAVEVGDVGFIRRGYFQRLFNVLHPKDHPSHRNSPFVPEDHQQLPTIPNHIVKNEIRTGSRQNSIHFCSEHVTLESRGRGASASGPEDDSEVSFSCNSKQGALLSLPVPAHGEDTLAFGDFGKWMIKHIDTWFAFARGLGLGINRMEDIILVTGRHLTKSWVNVAFTRRRRRDAGVSFNAQVSGHDSVSLEQQYVRGGDLKLGPTGRDLPENQCIFIRGFRVTRILGVWPRLRGRAGPTPNADDHETEPESNGQLELISIPADSNSQDPLHDLLQYIAKQTPECDMALVHDNDLAFIDGVPLKALRTHDLIELLPKSPQTIQQFQCDLLPGNRSGPGADVGVAKVATLSKYAFEAPREGSDLNTILTLGGATDTPPVASFPVIVPISTSSRLDRTAYDTEQKRMKTGIGFLREKLAYAKERIINLSLPRGLGIKRQTTLRARSEDLQAQDSSNETSRNEILAEGLQENAKSRIVDVDAHIRNIEEQVESSSTRVAEERRGAQREPEEGDKRKARALQLREDASQPTFQVQNEDRQTLIDFSGKSTIVPGTMPGHTSPMLPRKVSAVPDNFVPPKRKKISVGKDRRNLPGTFTPSALRQSILPPSSKEDLLEASHNHVTGSGNQTHVTAEAIAKAKAEIRRRMEEKQSPKVAGLVPLQATD